MLYQQINMNKRRTVYVVFGFCLLVALVGAAVGYWLAGSAVMGIIMALVIALIYTSVMIGQSTDVVMNMNHAHVVEDMAMVAQVPMPRVFIIDDPSPNAFATGNDPEHSAVAATTGLMQIMNREELEGVMGHEITHVRNYDIRLQTIALALSAAISFLVNLVSNFWWLGGGRHDDDEDRGVNIFGMIASVLLIILAPLAAAIAQMALSRNREYLADAGSVELTRNPQGMISALRKLEHAEPMQQADPSSASLYITDPEENAKRHRWLDHLFDTHPPLEDRITRLEEM